MGRDPLGGKIENIKNIYSFEVTFTDTVLITGSTPADTEEEAIENIMKQFEGAPNLELIYIEKTGEMSEEQLELLLNPGNGTVN